MAQSERSRGPRRPDEGRSPAGGPGPRAPARRSSPAAKPGQPAARPPAAKSGKGATRSPPTTRPAAQTRLKAGGKAPGARSPAAERTVAPTRLKAGGKRPTVRTTATAEPTEGPVIARPPVWKRALEWLLEDPKARQGGPSEREKALQAVAERDRAARRAVIRAAFHRRRGKGFVEGISLALDAPALPRAPRAAPKVVRPPTTLPAPQEAAHARTGEGTIDDQPAARRGDRPDEGAGSRVFALATLWHRLLGERHHEDKAGNKVVVPPRESDWRWHLHRFFRSNVRGVAYARGFLLMFLVLSAAWVSLYASTGYDYLDVVFDRTDPEDPRTQYKLPFFIVESGSMMRTDASWGRVGTVDPGDMVIVEKYDDDMVIETYYGGGERKVAGAKGDVIVFLPVRVGNGPEPTPTIHRAIAYIERDQYNIPNPEPRGERSITVTRYTVEEFGIVNAGSISIPELGLYNYQPRSSGYITRGDNERSNTWADQALGVTPHPVPKDRIIGRMMGEVPAVGLTKIALAGQDPATLSVDGAWCTFLAGKAACDTWVLFFIIVIVFVGVPLVITSVVFGRRLWRRHLDRLALRQQQEAGAHPFVGRPGEDDPAPAVVMHDATDLLSGKVTVVSGQTVSRPRATTLPRGTLSDDGL